MEQGEEDGEVESGEGEDVAGACFGEEGADLGVQAGFVAQGEGGKDGGLFGIEVTCVFLYQLAAQT